jgi:antitoxin CptB
MERGEARLRRLQWRCRRGMKEIDILLERFVTTHAEALARGEWPALESLLEAEDDRLWDWLQGRAVPSDDARRELVEAMRRG